MNKNERLSLRLQAGQGPPTEHVTFRACAFRAAPWLTGPHLQTMAGKYLRPRGGLELKRLRLSTPDDDFLDIDLGPDTGSHAPVVLVLHGLEGSTRRAYVRAAMSALTEAGIRAVGLNFRSCSGEPNRLARSYHSGETGDLSFVIERLEEMFPDRPLGAMGFSLGGNVLLRYLGESHRRRPGPLRCAAAISVPYDLAEGAKMLERGVMGSVYTRYFLRSLKEKARVKKSLLEGLVDFDRVLGARTLRDFDEAATAPVHGFHGATEYYREASSGPILPRIKVPTYLLHALDDPFLPAQSVPRAEVTENPWLIASFPQHGGHVGFVGWARGPRPEFWAENEAVRYLATILASPSSPK